MIYHVRSKQSFMLLCTPCHIKHLCIIFVHICINLPYVQTTKGSISPPKIFQFKAVLLAMLSKQNTRKNIP